MKDGKHMYTMGEAGKAVGNSAIMARGRAYVQEGRIEAMTVREDGESVFAQGEVCGRTGRYAAHFCFQGGTLANASCSCSYFKNQEKPCKHVAALMIAANAQLRKAELHRQEELRRQEEERRIEEEEKEREQIRQTYYVNALIASGGNRRLRSFYDAPDEIPVRLFPILEKKENALGLELKIGRTRPYVVRNLSEFAERVQRGMRVVYGKELTFGHSEAEVDAADRALFWHIVQMAEGKPAGSQILLTGAQIDQTMRLLLGRDVLTKDGTPVKVTEGGVHMALALEEKENGARLHVRAASVLLGSVGAYTFGPGAIVCTFGREFDSAAALLRVAKEYPDGLEIGKEQLGEVCAQVIAPAQKQITVVKGRKLIENRMPLPLEITFYVDMPQKNRLLCRVAFAYSGIEVLPEAHTPSICRDTLLEREALCAVRTLFPESVSPSEFAFSGEDEAIFALLADKLHTLEQLGQVMIAERLAQKRVSARRAMMVGLSPSGAKLLVRADLGGLSQEELDAAYLAYRQKKRFVRLTDGTFLADEALEQAADAAEMAQSLDLPAEALEKGAEVPMSRGLYLEKAVKARKGMQLHAPDALTDFMERLEMAQKMQMDQPKGLRATLRGYQQTGLSWLCALSEAGFGGILADDMGLGKTIQMLAMLLTEKEAGKKVRALVVCPASLQLNWKSEAARFAPDLRCLVLSGGAKERAEQIGREDVELLIASYDQLRRDVQMYQGIELTHVLLDEAQYIKNAASQAARAVKTLNAAHRFAMTGTPIENRLSELWSIFDFLMPGYLHSYKKFRERFEAPIVQDGSEKAQKNLHLMTAPFILRRMKRDVLDDLPEKTETVMTSEMTPEQRRAYRGCAAQLLRQTKGNSAQERIRMLAGLTRLRQICCDPRLCLEGYTGGSGKLTQTVELVQQLEGEGHRMLLFSQFTSMLDILEEAFNRTGLSCFKLTGDTDKRERMRLVEAFNAGDTSVFLISLKAGGTGLNLTGADVVIHYDPWWNTAAQNQASDRAYRIGQTRGVEVISMIAADTVEERILQMQEEKQALSDGILEGGENLFTVDAELLRKIL